jgi:hypothetical protein
MQLRQIATGIVILDPLTAQEWKGSGGQLARDSQEELLFLPCIERGDSPVQDRRLRPIRAGRPRHFAARATGLPQV